MESTPKSLRLHIALFGRTNVGKSSFLNLISGQDVAITSPLPGTTTDAVEKTMELQPIGPVVFIDTAGFEDTTLLGEERIRRSFKVFDRADVILLLCEPGIWGRAEELILAEAAERKIPVIAVITKTDVKTVTPDFAGKLLAVGVQQCIHVSSADFSRREESISALKLALLSLLPDDFVTPPPLLGNLIQKGKLLLLVVPIDIEAPKGRLILPQVQTIRDALDQDAIVMAVKENEYPGVLGMLKELPALVVCDSQVVNAVVRDTPPEIPCTTFSILFSRLKGDFRLLAEGSRAIPELKDQDKILIAEACSHHAAEDDIGRVKIPRLLKKFTGKELIFEVASGRDYPENLKEYSLVVHCGGCMLNRREILSRLQKASAAGVPVTNYGMCISTTFGVLERVLAPFEDELK